MAYSPISALGLGQVDRGGQSPGNLQNMGSSYGPPTQPLIPFSPPPVSMPGAPHDPVGLPMTAPTPAPAPPTSSGFAAYGGGGGAASGAAFGRGSYDPNLEHYKTAWGQFGFNPPPDMNPSNSGWDAYVNNFLSGHR